MPSFAAASNQKIMGYEHAAWGPNQGVPPHIEAIAQNNDDFLWIGSGDGLFRFDGLGFERYQTQSGPALPADHIVSLLPLPDGDLWVGFYSGGISLVHNGTAVNYGRQDGLPGLTILSLAQDAQGALWASCNAGLFRLENDQWKQMGRDWNFPGAQARALYVDRSGTLWVATEDTIVFLPRGARKFHPTGIRVGVVSQFNEAPNGKLWMAETTRSVRPVPLQSKLPPSDDTEVRVGSRGILFSSFGDLWITTLGDGVLRAADPGQLRGKPDRFSSLLESFAVEDGLTDQVATCIFQDRDGNIWVGTLTGLDRFRQYALNNHHALSGDPRPRPPSVDSIAANGQSYRRLSNLKLPAGTRSLEVNYSAADLAAPWILQFAYKMDGVDTQWQDAGARRTAYYTNLHPGEYHFHVKAGNRVTGWNPNAGVVDFTIPPFWYQARWFQVLCCAAAVLLLWAIYQLRLRQMERQFAVAQGTRVDERVRIARELHDTLLQSFHGLLFQFQAARNQLPGKPEHAMQTLDKAILATERAIAEGRDAIRDLRPDCAAERDLGELLREAAEDLASTHAAGGSTPAMRVIAEGRPRRLSPPIRDEIYRIGREAILNAFRHAVAGSIEVEIEYGVHQLRLRIRDDGKGIDEENLEAGGRTGHWGLRGIRERAQRIGSRLEIWSEAGAGTEVELRVPGAVAYERQRDGRRFWSFRRGGSHDGRP